MQCNAMTGIGAVSYADNPLILCEGLVVSSPCMVRTRVQRRQEVPDGNQAAMSHDCVIILYKVVLQGLSL